MVGAGWSWFLWVADLLPDLLDTLGVELLLQLGGALLLVLFAPQLEQPLDLATVLDLLLSALLRIELVDAIVCKPGAWAGALPTAASRAPCYSEIAWRQSRGRTFREFLEHRHPKVVFLQLLFLSADGLQLSLVLVGEGDVELPAHKIVTCLSRMEASCGPDRGWTEALARRGRGLGEPINTPAGARHAPSSLSPFGGRALPSLG